MKRVLAVALASVAFAFSSSALAADQVARDDPRNKAVLAYLGDAKRREGSDSTFKDALSTPPSAVDEQKAWMKLGTHPDLIDWLFETLGGKLPAKCSWIVYGTPALVHPKTGVVFAFAGGTHDYALHVSAATLALAKAKGAKTMTIGGEEWIKGAWKTEESAWALDAYELAAHTP